MNIAELEARKDAVWEAYSKLVAAASASQHGSLAELAYQRAHGLITDPDPEGFKTFEAEVKALQAKKPAEAKEAAAAPDEAQEVEYADEEADDEEDEAREASHEPHHKAAKTHRHK